MADRKLTIDGVVWLYRVGKGSIKIRDPQGKGHPVNFSELTGKNWHELERDIHKRNLAITPGQVRKYIDKHLR